MGKNDDLIKSVGYKSPPKHSRFRPGQSGNPKGRPKGSLNVATVLTKVLREKVRINENGRRKQITKLEAFVKQLVNKAASGDLRAISNLFSMTTVLAEQSGVEGQPTNEPLNERDQEVVSQLLMRYGQLIKPEGDNGPN